MKEISKNNILFRDPNTNEWVPIPAVTTGGATAEQVAQIEKNTSDISQLSEEIAKLSSGSSGLTTAQINALDGMFKVAAYDDSKDVSGAYAAFKEAFGLNDSGESGGEPDVTTYTILQDC